MRVCIMGFYFWIANELGFDAIERIVTSKYQRGPAINRPQPSASASKNSEKLRAPIKCGVPVPRKRTDLMKKLPRAV
jgi:hypothetical protein